MSVHGEIIRLKESIGEAIVGQEAIIEALLLGLLANGNLLVEGLPGLAKTRAIKALAENIEGSFGRIQFTPDLISSDITGKEVVHHSEASERPLVKFEKGPIFNNIVLADEINRAPSKTQNALLEAMEERQVTVSGVSHKMAPLFLVMATQNPSKQHGTYPLPEAQQDRFLMQIGIGYPDEEAEADIIRVVRAEQRQDYKKVKKEDDKNLVMQDTIFTARGEIDNIHVPKHLEQYMVDLVFATRYPQRHSFELKSYIREGSSPRASIALDRCSRAHAWLKGHDEVTVDDIRTVVTPVLRHRIGVTDRALERDVITDELIEDIVELVKVPEA